MDILSLLRQLRFLNSAVKHVVPQEQAAQIRNDTELILVDIHGSSEGQNEVVQESPTIKRNKIA